MDEAVRAEMGRIQAERHAAVAPRPGRPKGARALPKPNGETRIAKRPAYELRDLDAMVRGKYLDLLAEENVLKRVRELLTSTKDDVVIAAFKVIAPVMVVQRKDGEGEHRPAVNLNFNMPRPALDVTP